MFLNESQLLQYDDTLSKLKYYQLFITHHLKIGSNIPERVYKKYFFLLEEFDKTGRKNAIEKYAILLSGALKEKFEKQGYCFKQTDYSFEKMIIGITERYFSNVQATKKWSKDDWIRFLYFEMYDYRKQFLNKKDKKKFSKYKIQVLAAFMVKEMGFKLSENKNLKNKDLFNLARNAVSQMGTVG